VPVEEAIVPNIIGVTFSFNVNEEIGVMGIEANPTKAKPKGVS